eukprot:scaffold33152_cov143-Isochrysis_galbana.AAC.1
MSFNSQAHVAPRTRTQGTGRRRDVPPLLAPRGWSDADKRRGRAGLPGRTADDGVVGYRGGGGHAKVCGRSPPI